MPESHGRFRSAEFDIGGIRTIIIDSHNEIIPHWFKEYLRRGCSLVVVRIDEHHDMFHKCPSFPAREGRQSFAFLTKLMPYLWDYCKRKVNEGNFTCPAFHYGALGVLYHFNPREKEINAYGRVFGAKLMDPPKTKEECIFEGASRSRWIVWDGAMTKLKGQCEKAAPIPKKIAWDDFRRDLEESLFPAVIGFDLDGLYGLGDKGPLEKVAGRRLERVKHILECVSSPAFICLARSQTPKAYVPPEKVDDLQSMALSLLERLYG
ncbi:Uncharacterised protein [uncultured archaeon]|nr:Uncharacterised protein [uncultured archaeon]